MNTNTLQHINLTEEPHMSISGEGGFIPQGGLCTIIRFQGCNLRCSYCDTKRSQDPTGGLGWLTPNEIKQRCVTKAVLITGGEPLTQPTMLAKLMKELYTNNHLVQIETNGSYPIDVPNRKHTKWVIDRKGPSSGYRSQLLPTHENYGWRNGNVVFKYVISNGVTDFVQDWAFALADMEKISGDGYTGYFLLSAMDADPFTIGKLMTILGGSDTHFRDQIILSLQLHKVVGLA